MCATDDSKMDGHACRVELGHRPHDEVDLFARVDPSENSDEALVTAGAERGAHRRVGRRGGEPLEVDAVVHDVDVALRAGRYARRDGRARSR